MCQMTRCVTNARAHVVVGNLLLSFVPMSLACSITVSFVGQTSTLVPDVSSTSHWSRKVPIVHVRSTSAGIKDPPPPSAGLRWKRKEKGACGIPCLKITTCRRNKCILLLSPQLTIHASFISSQNTTKPLVFHQNPTSQAY